MSAATVRTAASTAAASVVSVITAAVVAAVPRTFVHVTERAWSFPAAAAVAEGMCRSISFYGHFVALVPSNSKD
jgi:uncharacterized low-complexity protein